MGSTWVPGLETNMKKTKYPGIGRTDDGRYHIRVTGRCPKTGKKTNRKLTLEDRATIQDAIRIREELRSEILEGTHVGADRTRVTDAAISWLSGKRRALKPSTADRYACALDHCLASLGEIYLDRLRSTDIVGWRNSQPGKASTVNSRLRVLKTMLADVCAERELRNPAERVRALPTTSSYDDENPNSLSRDELTTLLAVASRDPRWFPVFLFLACTGARFGEMAALQWGDIDFGADTIRIRRAKWKQTIGTTKTGRTRSIPLSPALGRELLALHSRAACNGGGDIVFPSSCGTLLSNGAARTALVRALAQTKIMKRFTLHGFRRTFNNLLRQNGVSVMVIQSLTGHSTDRMTEHYSNIDAGEKLAAVQQLAEVIPFRAKPRAGSRCPERCPSQAPQRKRPVEP